MEARCRECENGCKHLFTSTEVATANRYCDGFIYIRLVKSKYIFVNKHPCNYLCTHIIIRGIDVHIAPCDVLRRELNVPWNKPSRNIWNFTFLHIDNDDYTDWEVLWRVLPDLDWRFCHIWLIPYLDQCLHLRICLWKKIDVNIVQRWITLIKRSLPHLNTISRTPTCK